MLEKTIQVQVDATTWPKKRPTPSFLTAGAGTPTLDLKKALLLLGSITMPNIFSVGSPARFWAWVRYFLAPGKTDDLRIIMPFAELDPHQKGILSDDFGVAISTHWLIEQLGGYLQIIDGRRFISQFSDLLPKQRYSKAKVGPSKAPDFVIQDSSGNWHVLECKGTQSGRTYRNDILRTAVSQKHVIRILGPYRGERLAAGLALSNEADPRDTHLKVIDPESEPLITLRAEQMDDAAETIKRLSVARALALVGLDQIAEELALPSKIERDSVADFMTTSELARSQRSRSDRLTDALDQLSRRQLRHFQVEGELYGGRAIRVEVPEERSSIAAIVVRQGVRKDFLHSLGDVRDDLQTESVRRAEQYRPEEGVRMKSNETFASLHYGDLLYSDVKIIEKKVAH
jgi:hypothetical protein